MGFCGRRLVFQAGAGGFGGPFGEPKSGGSAASSRPGDRVTPPAAGATEVAGRGPCGSSDALLLAPTVLLLPPFPLLELPPRCV